MDGADGNGSKNVMMAEATVMEQEVDDNLQQYAMDQEADDNQLWPAMEQEDDLQWRQSGGSGQQLQQEQQQYSVYASVAMSTVHLGHKEILLINVRDYEM